LLNPNGIIFGEGARLDLGGSFSATTADSVVFADGFEFSASDTDEPPLLTVEVPVGLGFAENSGLIAIDGSGNQFFVESSSPIQSPILEVSPNTTGLKTPVGKTIAVLGGPVKFDGAVVTAPSGNIEVGSIEQGLLGINSTPSGLTFDYSNIEKFHNIELTQKTSLNASRLFNGNINLRGNNIDIAIRNHL
jgi:large exoprotein involved in heme utilization and adhesion